MANKLTNEVSEEYLNFIQDSIKLGTLSKDHAELNTPFIDSTGENISFSIYHEGNDYILSDDGFTIWDLSIEGIDVSKKGNRKDILESNIKYSGFNIKDNKITKKVNKKNLGQAVHEMTQLLIKLYDLTYLHRNIVSNQFFIDVENYFSSHKDTFSYFSDFSIKGKSLLDHQFDYVFISKEKSKLTRVEKNISKNKVDSILISWLDTMEYRKNKRNEQLYIILSREGYKELKPDHELALDQYNIKVLDFSDKQSIKLELSA